MGYKKLILKFLRFHYKENLHEFNVAPFGLNIAPYLFTKILKPLPGDLRHKCFLSVVYLDDWLLLGNSIADCKLNKLYIIKLIKSLGFTRNGYSMISERRFLLVLKESSLWS
nr:unnamed protein product [Callosobruchus chinensis]